MGETDESWQVRAFQSGTVVVESLSCLSHYYVWQVPGDVTGKQRYKVAKELCDWLNGRSTPAWLSGCVRGGDESITLPNGCNIIATGPSVDVSCPPGGLLWREDESDQAKDLRKSLIDRLTRFATPGGAGKRGPV